MIKKLYLVHTSGICISYIDYENLKIEIAEKQAVHPQLESGFFTAIISFFEGKTSDPAGEQTVCKLEWKNVDILFYNVGKFYLIIENDNKNMNLNEEDWNNIFKYLASEITSMIESGQLEEDSGKIPDFTDFENNSREYISKVLRKSLLRKFSH